MAKKFDWKKYEAELVKCVEEAVREVMEQYPDEHFYGAAFHSFYREHGDRIGFPCLAVNTEEETNEDLRWSSPDWYWDNLECEGRVLANLHCRLNEIASSEGDEYWESVHDQWMESLIRAAKRLTASLRKTKQATKDFGFFLFDEESDEMVDVLRRCMTPAKFKKLFPDLLATIQREQTVEELPVSKKVALYANDLSESNCEKLLDLGEKAIPALINVLDGDDGWLAARLLGRLGIRDLDAIDALKTRVTRSAKSSLPSHAAGSLGLLGETEFLLALAKKAGTRKLAIEAIRRQYSNFLTRHTVVHVPLDYLPLEQLLAIDACRKLAQKPHDTGGYFNFALESREIKPGDVDEAIRGTTSKYKMIREHAVCCLGNRGLGKACSEKAMQTMVDCFDDRAMSVRRLAVLCIRYWKKAAVVHLPAIRKCAREDPDPDVRDAARATVRELG